MKLNAYLFFNGNCKEALEYYAKVLGGDVVAMLPHRGTPAEEGVPDDWKDKIMHGRIVVGDNVLMASDSPPQYAEQPAGFSISINLDDVAEAERIFNGLADGGTVTMPLAETFWANRFGMLKDRFGIGWMVNCGEKSM